MLFVCFVIFVRTLVFYNADGYVSSNLCGKLVVRRLLVVIVVIVLGVLLIWIGLYWCLVALRLLLHVAWLLVVVGVSVCHLIVVCNRCLSHLNSLHILIVLDLLCCLHNSRFFLFASTYKVCITELFFFLNRSNWLLLVRLLLIICVVVVSLLLIVVTLIVVCWCLPIIVNWLNGLLNRSLSIVVRWLNSLLVVVVVVLALVISLVLLLVVVVALLIVALIVLIVVVIGLLLSCDRFGSSTDKIRVAHSFIYWLTHLHWRLLFSTVEVI